MEFRENKPATIPLRDVPLGGAFRGTTPGSDICLHVASTFIAGLDAAQGQLVTAVVLTGKRAGTLLDYPLDAQVITGFFIGEK